MYPPVSNHENSENLFTDPDQEIKLIHFKSNVENGAIFPIYTGYREKCEKFPKQFPKDG